MYYPMDVDDVPAASGSQPDRLLDVSGPQERVQRRTMEQLVDSLPVVPSLDAPVPLMVEQLVDVLRCFDSLFPVAEQVIDVPKIFANLGSRAAAGGTVGGSADNLVLSQAVDCRADRRHSSSWWWRATRRSPRFSSRTEFNSADCRADR